MDRTPTPTRSREAIATGKSLAGVPFPYPRRMYLVMPPDVRDALIALAVTELRDARDQAVVLVREGLQARGLIAPGPDETR